MPKREILTQLLAIAGAALVWFPILTPAVLSAVSLVTRPVFRFDYLMPAELFPVALPGGGLLLWAALRARARRRLIGWGLGIAVAALVSSQALAVVAGLASGAAEPAGVWWALVLGAIAVYTLALVVLGLAGIRLLRDLFKAS